MSSGNVEDRLVRLEQKVRQLEDVTRPAANTIPWWERVTGVFKDDSVYAEAMKLARDERDAESVEESSE